ncbi:hypothetical protein LF887_15275 [Chryseobacterium sp. MEBOG06]|uniref:hypothetical protein n=1 Tax=unclassified Chryseobacterium TaxID=2593645 RepID=UPI001F3667EA|nr:MULTISPECIES: hypothetical protein [unclassified Chryseobacterium]UKB82365.1 hypothetical protein LF887_15275 [Chryseobacterium sp. MEBOG06]
MKAIPVFPFLSEGTVMYRHKSIEYYHSSKKVFTIACIYDKEKEESVAAGFLFTGVEEVSQKLKTDKLLREFGLEDHPMFEFLFCLEDGKELKTYILAIGVMVLIIRAKDVELITEDIRYMA